MKTLIKSLALALTLGVATSAATFAEINPGTTAASYQSAIYTTNSGKLSIALDKQKGGAVDVSLKDAEGKVVFTRHLGKNESKYRTRLNLSELADGVYQVEITNGVETTSHKVTIATQQPVTPSRVIALN
ncbi:T9SS type A sorting domain-containing protein [Spirosoma sp. HMF4905]|uniref:T9SS type A sorting domain-containing protein n=1 Tax=Spirosoma arboris TaxID=2682092 RepID=A0A7K1SQ41_9BACT|nr:T9SS type A sorting domain-containing protein [Spirosoma arboris]MVM35922.1 T9SS type A sorting domain-containing protein [Spirosoma arboris]